MVGVAMAGLMRRTVVVAGAAVVLLGLAVGVASARVAAAGTHLAGGARAAASGGSWRTAIEVPGTGALNQSGDAEIQAMSCAAAGHCSAGGLYTDSTGHEQAFVVSQVNGTWHTAMEVPGTAALNVRGAAATTAVSCASAGNCSAGGSYRGPSGNHVFVVSQVNGTWQKAIEVPGIGALGRNQIAWIYSVSCASAGNCIAGGTLIDNSGSFQAFVVSQANGTWQKAIEVPGAAALNQGGSAQVSSVSCASAGNCIAVGGYTDGSSHSQAFVVSQTGGTWHTAVEMPGTAALNQGGNAYTASVSCRSAGNCSAGGSYADSSGHRQPFVVSQVNGIWHTAVEAPGAAALNRGGDALIYSLSCGSAGNCSAGGYYADSAGHDQAFVVSQTGGTWHTAVEVPGSAALNRGGGAEIAAMSCAAAGNCAAGGDYTDSSGHGQVFVVTQANGIWHTAVEVPGTAALNQGGNAQTISLSCGSAGNCSVGGFYADSAHHAQAFVDSEK
jgi:hypothetical protein